jgi:hypothetical protein
MPPMDSLTNFKGLETETNRETETEIDLDWEKIPTLATQPSNTEGSLPAL